MGPRADYAGSLTQRSTKGIFHGVHPPPPPHETYFIHILLGLAGIWSLDSFQITTLRTSEEKYMVLPEISGCTTSHTHFPPGKFSENPAKKPENMIQALACFTWKYTQPLSAASPRVLSPFSHIHRGLERLQQSRFWCGPQKLAILIHMVVWMIPSLIDSRTWTPGPQLTPLSGRFRRSDFFDGRSRALEVSFENLDRANLGFALSALWLQLKMWARSLHFRSLCPTLLPLLHPLEL